MLHNLPRAHTFPQSNGGSVSQRGRTACLPAFACDAQQATSKRRALTLRKLATDGRTPATTSTPPSHGFVQFLICISADLHSQTRLLAAHAILVDHH